MESQLQSLTFVIYASMLLLALFGMSAFLFANYSPEGSYRLVTVFLTIILFSNVTAIILIHE